MLVPRIVSVDTAKLQAEIRIGRSYNSQSVAIALQDALRPVARDMIDQTKSFADTWRYTRGWQIAFNAAGLGRIAVSPVIPSRIAERITRVLVSNAEYWRGLEVRKREQAESRGVSPNRWKHYRNAKRLAERAEEELQKWIESDYTGAIFWEKTTRGKRGWGVRNLTRVGPELYGGTGGTIFTTTGAFIQMVNLEPHARIVERSRRIAFNAAGRLRVLRVKRVRSRYAKELLKKTGWGTDESIAAGFSGEKSNVDFMPVPAGALTSPPRRSFRRAA